MINSQRHPFKLSIPIFTTEVASGATVEFIAPIPSFLLKVISIVTYQNTSGSCQDGVANTVQLAVEMIPLCYCYSWSPLGK